MSRHASRPAAGLVLILVAVAMVSLRPGPVSGAEPARTDGLLTLMPVPASVTPGEGRFRIDENLAIGGRPGRRGNHGGPGRSKAPLASWPAWPAGPAFS